MISYLLSTLLATSDTISFDESLIFVALEIGSRSSKLDREREKEREGRWAALGSFGSRGNWS